MKKTIKKSVLSLIIFLVLSLPFVSHIQVMYAQGIPFDPGENIQKATNLPKGNLKDTTVRIVQWALGFLGLIAAIFMIYGGIMWMTSAGNEERVKKAKSLLTSAVIGLIIILLSWAIVTFVVRTVSNTAK